MLYFILYMVIISIFSVVLVRSHVFMCLIMLEFVVISLLVLFIYNSIIFSGFFSVVLLIVFFVCEGVMGLSVLVSMIRFIGNDYMGMFSLW